MLEKRELVVCRLQSAAHGRREGSSAGPLPAVRESLEVAWKKKREKRRKKKKKKIPEKENPRRNLPYAACRAPAARGAASRAQDAAMFGARAV